MLDTYRIIRLEAEMMDLGETLRMVCPACKGGDHSERSLSITLFSDLQVKFQCFRASCPRKLKGLFYLTTAERNKKRLDIIAPVERKVKEAEWGFKHRDQKRKKFNGPTYPLTDHEKEWIFTAWGIQVPRFWYHTEQFGGRVAMSVRSPLFKPRGWVLRDIQGTARNKALTYLFDRQVPLSWYKGRMPPLKGTLIVEDIPSAVRAAPYIDTVALLGTGCGFDRAAEIAAFGNRPIIIGLDQDATSGSVAMLRRWGLMWGTCKILPLKQDLKNLQERELKDLMSTLGKLPNDPEHN